MSATETSPARDEQRAERREQVRQAVSQLMSEMGPGRRGIILVQPETGGGNVRAATLAGKTKEGSSLCN